MSTHHPATAILNQGTKRDARIHLMISDNFHILTERPIKRVSNSAKFRRTNRRLSITACCLARLRRELHSLLTDEETRALKVAEEMLQRLKLARVTALFKK